MKQLAFPLILLLTATLCHSNTLELPRLELPRKGESAIAIEITELAIAGQQRVRILTDRYDIIAPCTCTGTLAAERLEHLFRVWQLLAAEHFGERPLAAPLAERTRHRVVIYRDRDEYIRNLLPIEPAIRRTNGYYSAPRRTVYFHLPLKEIVLFHEGTHQILSEHFFSEKMPMFRNNFWAVEGIALFMETLNIGEESYKVGDIMADRLFAARIQHEQNFHMPIGRLTAMSAANIQASARITEIYRKSATLTHWLMFAEEGHHRKHLFELLRQTYANTASAETLSELTGLSFEELDRKYAEFLSTIPLE